MAENPQTDRENASPPHDAELLQISTPVIDIQDLEHNANANTRVSNKGVRVEPKMDSAEAQDVAKELEDALYALEQIEKSLRGELPG